MRKLYGITYALRQDNSTAGCGIPPCQASFTLVLKSEVACARGPSLLDVLIYEPHMAPSLVWIQVWKAVLAMVRLQMGVLS